MIVDPIVEELHRQREAYMERFNYDLDAIFRDIKAREAATPGPLLEPPSYKEGEPVMQRWARVAGGR
ncbi:MAG TPA: hypothetical protein VF017_18115 [Thermoanaerobaculia bacterium]|nr:hypothetical protein [Thermoanaerobaculia bacterium]